MTNEVRELLETLLPLLESEIVAEENNAAEGCDEAAGRAAEWESVRVRVYKVINE